MVERVYLSIYRLRNRLTKFRWAFSYDLIPPFFFKHDPHLVHFVHFHPLDRGFKLFLNEVSSFEGTTASSRTISY